MTTVLGATKGDVQRRRNEIGLACAACRTHKALTELRKCSRCFFANYCSRECQKSDWPQHKSHCKFTVDDPIKAILSLLANPRVRNMLACMICDLLGLAKDPSPIGPFLARLHVYFFPVEWRRLRTMRRSDRATIGDCPGYLQLALLDAIPIEAGDLQCWEKLQADCHDSVLSILEIAVEGTSFTLSSSIQVPTHMIDAKKAGELQYTSDSLMGSLNKIISNDEQNSLRVRVRMSGDEVRRWLSEMDFFVFN